MMGVDSARRDEGNRRGDGGAGGQLSPIRPKRFVAMNKTMGVHFVPKFVHSRRGDSYALSRPGSRKPLTVSSYTQFCTTIYPTLPQSAPRPQSGRKWSVVTAPTLRIPRPFLPFLHFLPTNDVGGNPQAKIMPALVTAAKWQSR